MSDGVSLGVSLGVSEGVSDGVGVSSGDGATFVGLGSSRVAVGHGGCSRPSWIPSMAVIHMLSGNEDPKTFSRPPVPRRVTVLPLASSLLIITAVATVGEYPTNQADLFSSVVPVLPASGMPRLRARLAVPLVTTLRSASVTSSATAGWIRCWPSVGIV